MIKETRLSKESVSIRSDAGDSRLVEGYASVFNKRSRLIAEDGKVFYEVMNARAFDKVLADPNLNVVANFQHQDSNMLARTKSGTLTLTTDEVGLRYSFIAPNTSLGNDIVEWLTRGDISESSFRYSYSKDNVVWSRHSDGVAIREILEVSRLSDVALVLNGAYADTDVGVVRELQEFEAQEQALKDELESKRKQELSAYYKQLEKRI